MSAPPGRPYLRDHDVFRLNVPMVDDTDDAGIDRDLGGQERQRSFTAPDEEHLLAFASAHRVDANDRSPGGPAVRSQRLQYQQRETTKVGILLCGHDRPRYTR
jgi:hypothetical protein